MDNSQIKSDKSEASESVDQQANEPEGEDIVASADQPIESVKQEATEVQSDEDSRLSEPAVAGELENRAQTDEGASQPEQEDANSADTPNAETPTSKSTDNPNAKWYVIHTYSGHENKVAAALKQRVESERLEKKILETLVPTQDKIEIKSGKKVNIKEKIFPGYILVKMVLDDTSWLAVRTIQGVTSFVGIGNKPTPISETEVQTIMQFTSAAAPVFKQVFIVNDTVKIVDGPFADFIGKVDNVDGERGKVKVLVSIFGRETPVELDFLQVQKI